MPVYLPQFHTVLKSFQPPRRKRPFFEHIFNELLLLLHGRFQFLPFLHKAALQAFKFLLCDNALPQILI